MYQMRKMAIALAVVSLVFMVGASATIIGDLKTGTGSTATVSLTNITWNPDPSANPAGPPWNAQVSNGTSLTFAGCPSGVLGTAGCLDAAPFGPTEGVQFTNLSMANAPPPPLPFITFAGNGVTHATLVYTLTQLGPGSSNTNCAGLTIGQSCSVFAGSPIILTDEPTGTNISLSVMGTASDGAGSSNWLGLLSVPFTKTLPNGTAPTPQNIQLFFCPSGTCTPADFTSGKTLSSPHAGDFIASAVPEPGTISMALIGLGLSALAFRKRKDRA